MSSVALPPPAALPVGRPYWSPKNVADLLGVSRRTVWTMVARGQLPRPLRVSGNVVRWPASDITAFLNTLRPTA